MATKKPVVKKATATTKASAKASTSKKTPSANKSAVQKSTATKTNRKKKDAPMQSFRLSRECEPFMRFRITDQTIYWLIIAAISIAFVSWIFKVQNDIDELYLQIDRIQQQEVIVPIE